MTDKKESDPITKALSLVIVWLICIATIAALVRLIMFIFGM